MENRPQGLTVVGAVTMGAGALSACCNLYGMVSTVMQVAIGARFGGELGSDPQTARLMSMQREMAIYTGIPAVLGVIAAAFLLAGGGLVLSMKPVGRTVLIGALGGALFVALVETALSAVMQFRMWGTFEGMAGGGPGLGGMDGMGIVKAAGIGMAGLWLVLKLGVYVPCLAYMLRAETATFFGGARRVGARGD